MQISLWVFLMKFYHYLNNRVLLGINITIHGASTVHNEQNSNLLSVLSMIQKFFYFYIILKTIPIDWLDNLLKVIGGRFDKTWTATHDFIGLIYL